MLTTATSKNTVQNALSLITKRINGSSTERDGLLTGNLGKVLFNFYLYQYTSIEKYNKKGQHVLEEVLSKLPKGTSKVVKNISLSSGLSGLAWCLDSLLEEKLIDCDATLLLEKADQSINNAVCHQIEENNLDFLNSSIGALNYLTNRAERNMQLKASLEMHVKALQRKMEDYMDGGAFIQNLYIYKRFGNVENTDVNLSISHGLCSILLVLINIYEIGIAHKYIKDTIERGINFILSTMKIDNINDYSASVFPSNIIVSLPKDHQRNLAFYKQRLGWCYGDLNQVLLLYRAGYLFDQKNWITIADTVGAFTLKKKESEHTFIRDCYLCHGSAGVAKVYQNLYLLSGNEKYLEGYTYWINRTVVYLKEMFIHNIFPQNPYSLLEGLAGTGLTLISYLQEKNSSWEKLLLLR